LFLNINPAKIPNFESNKLLVETPTKKIKITTIVIIGLITT
jgi:hypothetical protein